jgi:hypothetical protein
VVDIWTIAAVNIGTPSYTPMFTMFTKPASMFTEAVASEAVAAKASTRSGRRLGERSEHGERRPRTWETCEEGPR